MRGAPRMRGRCVLHHQGWERPFNFCLKTPEWLFDCSSESASDQRVTFLPGALSFSSALISRDCRWHSSCANESQSHVVDLKREERAKHVAFEDLILPAPNNTRQLAAHLENSVSYNHVSTARKHLNASLNLLDAKQILHDDLGIDFYLIAGSTWIRSTLRSHSR